MIQKLLLFAAAVMPFSYSPVGAQTPQVAKPSLEFRLASDSATAGWKEMSAPKSEKTLFVSNDVALNGGHIDRVSFYKNKRGIPCVGLTMTDEGGKAMKATTSQNLRKKLAIVLNGKVVSAPTINSTITKSVEINGNFDNKDLLAFFHATVLREAP